MTYIDYMNQFWRVVSVHPIPASEVALYAFLVNECNARYWKMPVPCPTYYICEALHMSKQTVMTARKHLAEQGLVKFTNGKSRYLPSNYYLLDLTHDLTDRLTHDLTLYNNKNKDKDYNQAQISNSNHHDTGTIKNRRRAVEVRTASAEDYEAAF